MELGDLVSIEGLVVAGGDVSGTAMTIMFIGSGKAGSRSIDRG